jgi:hypothetical protein
MIGMMEGIICGWRIMRLISLVKGRGRIRNVIWIEIGYDLRIDLVSGLD